MQSSELERRISELNPSPIATPQMQVAVVNSAGETIRVNAQYIADLYVPDLNKCDVGLCHVDNTSDVEKIVSDPTQDALDLKSNANHQHLSQAITDFVPTVRSLIERHSSVILGDVEW